MNKAGFPPFLFKSWMQIERFLFSPSDDPRFKLFRISLALSGLAYLLASWHLLGDQLAASSFHLKSEAFKNIPLLSLPYLACFPWTLALALLGLAAGYGTRFFASLCALGFYYWYAADPVSGSAHMKLLAFGFILIAVCTASLKKTLWPLRVIQLTLACVYFLAGWRKAVFGGWIENPDALWLQLAGPFRTEAGSWALIHLPPLFFSAGQYLSLAFELGAPFLFFDRKLRPYALATGIIFHLLIALFMDHLIYFSMAVLGFYWAFVPWAGPSSNSSGQEDKNSAEAGNTFR